MKKNWIERVVLAVSAIVVLSTAAFLIDDVMKGSEGSPEITLSLGQPERQTECFLVPVTVHNRGNETAEAVQIEVELTVTGKTTSSNFEIEFLPRKSTRSGWVSFDKDPASGRLKPRVLGFERP